MSPIALADARTTNRRRGFCLAVAFLLFVSAICSAETPYFIENFRQPYAVSHRVVVQASLSPAVLGQAYSSKLGVAGGVPPYRFSIAQGALPSGLSLNSITGVISGVPKVSGTYAFTVAASSQNGSGSKSSKIDVGHKTHSQISVSVSPQTAQLSPGAKLQFTAAVSNTSDTSVTWSANSGSISSSGLYTAPISGGTAVITATSAADSQVNASATISVQTVSPLTIATSSLTSAQVNVPYSATLTAQGGASPYVWSISSGALPGGLSLDSNTGVLAGTVSQAGVFTFTVTVTDSSSQSSSQQLTLDAAVVNSGNFDGPAELPRTTVQSAMANTPAPGNTITVAAGANVQTAINNANCGDTIQLQAGATFTGNFKLPAKNCDDNNWIIIRTSAPDGSLPAEGTRISPCYAGVSSLPGRPALNCASTQKVMATLMSGVAAPINLAAGATHYRLGPGLEITRPIGSGIRYGLIAKNPNDPVDHIIIDRDWVHGTAQDETVRGFNVSGLVYAAVVDSYFNDFHCVAAIGGCTDAQAIAGGTGDLVQGTFKIENNFLESSAENILFGGAGGSTVPTDITIRHNHMFKPLTWMPGNVPFVGGVNTDPTQCVRFNQPGFCPFVVKNLFELKNAQRVLLEGNVLENTWAGFSQPGIAILFQALNQTNSNNPNTTVADITVRYNRIAHAASGITEAIVCLSCSVNPAFAGRFSIHDDIFDDLNPFYGLGEVTVNTAKPFQIGQCETCATIQSVAIDHVTMLMAAPKTFMVLGDMPTAPIQDVKVTNSIVSSLPGTVIIATGNGGSCAFTGTSTLARLNNCLAPGYKVSTNALIGASGVWPSGNFFPTDASGIQFTDYNNGNAGDYHLLSTSPYKNAGSDGADLGANVDAVEQATAGAQ